MIIVMPWINFFDNIAGVLAMYIAGSRFLAILYD